MIQDATAERTTFHAERDTAVLSWTLLHSMDSADIWCLTGWLCCVQDRDAVYKAWLLGLKVLLILHMVSHTMLHKVAPSVFAGPRMIEVTMGTLPYRRFMSAIYQDGILFTGFLAAATAFTLHIL